MQALTNRTFDKIDVGASTSVKHTLYKTEIEMLALVAGDVDAFHIDVQEATRERTDDSVVVEAAGAGALLANVLNRRLLGLSVWVIPTNEELMIARHTQRVLLQDSLSTTFGSAGGQTTHD